MMKGKVEDAPGLGSEKLVENLVQTYLCIHPFPYFIVLQEG